MQSECNICLDTIDEKTGLCVNPKCPNSVPIPKGK